MTFEMTRIKQRLADLEKNQGSIQQRLRVDSEHKSTTNQRLVQLEKNQEKLLKLISEVNSTMAVVLDCSPYPASFLACTTSPPASSNKTSRNFCCFSVRFLAI